VSEEKFPGSDIEEQKARLRLEETEPDAQDCQACREARRLSKDPTDLCAAHLRKVYGL
jgi:hypothetical protein